MIVSPPNRSERKSKQTVVCKIDPPTTRGSGESTLVGSRFLQTVLLGIKAPSVRSVSVCLPDRLENCTVPLAHRFLFRNMQVLQVSFGFICHQYIERVLRSGNMFWGCVFATPPRATNLTRQLASRLRELVLKVTGEKTPSARSQKSPTSLLGRFNMCFFSRTS